MKAITTMFATFPLVAAMILAGCETTNDSSSGGTGAGNDASPKVNPITAQAPATGPAVAEAPAVSPTLMRCGFAVFKGDGATWVFATSAPELKDHMAGRELAKHVTKIRHTGAGIVTVKAPDAETIAAYLAARPGFVTRIVDGYLWVFIEGSPELRAVQAGDELAKHVTKMSNVNGQVRTIKAPDKAVIDAYLPARPGYATRLIGGYLWVFAQGSNDLAVVDAGGELAKHVTKITNVDGQVRTLKAPDGETLRGYLLSKPGFIARVVDGYLWVFRDDSPEFDTIAEGGELAKHVTRINAVGGDVVTIKAPDSETLVAYLADQ